MEFLARLFGFSSTTQDACDCPSCQTQRNCPECGQPIKITKPKMEEKPAILTGAFTSPRAETVQELARLVDEHLVVHVRGTPSSGKTTLAYLLFKYYHDQGIPVVILNLWPRGKWFEDKLVEAAHEAGHRSVRKENLASANIVFILDEAQKSYGDLRFWNNFIKMQSGGIGGPRIVLFTSYGSPTQGSDSWEGAATPVRFVAAQRVSILPSKFRSSPRISLFYNREEFDDVIDRLCRDELCPLPLHTEARAYILSLTNGHPGAVRAVHGMLQKVYRSDLKHGRISVVTKEHILSTLDDESQAFEFITQSPVYRSFPEGRALTPQAADVLRTVLVDGSILRDLSNEGIKLCYEMGWLHAEPTDRQGQEVVCVFPTPLHAKYVEHYLTTATQPFPTDRFPTVEAFAEAALRRFSPRALSATGRVGASAVIRPCEAAYQDEFYRAIRGILGFSTNVTSEWTTNGDEGRIDFRLGAVKWGIELVREGDRLREHCERFTANGSYWRWISSGEIKDWLIIDCRTSRSRRINMPGAKLWRAVFAKDFTSVEVLDSSNNVIIERFALRP